jgi:hypothetical protein
MMKNVPKNHTFCLCVCNTVFFFSFFFWKEKFTKLENFAPENKTKNSGDHLGMCLPMVKTHNPKGLQQ